MNPMYIIILLVGLLLAISGFWRGITLKRVLMRALPPEIRSQAFVIYDDDVASQKRGVLIFNWILFVLGIALTIAAVVLIAF